VEKQGHKEPNPEQRGTEAALSLISIWPSYHSDDGKDDCEDFVQENRVEEK